LIQLIGRGSLGAVFRAERVDGEVHQQVAVKLMQGGVGDPLQRQRFLQERQILGQVRHGFRTEAVRSPEIAPAPTIVAPAPA
jgi:hypothetical protein